MAAVVPVLIGLVLVVIVLGGAVLGARGVLVDVGVGDGDLVVTPRGFRSLLAVRRRVVVPLRSIEHVEVVDRTSVRLGLRMPGTALPGVIVAGTFGFGDERTFAFFARAPRVVVVSLSAGRYRRLVVQVPDPDATAEKIEAARSRA
jgi:hypothetical protein